MMGKTFSPASRDQTAEINVLAKNARCTTKWTHGNLLVLLFRPFITGVRIARSVAYMPRTTVIPERTTGLLMLIFPIFLGVNRIFTRDPCDDYYHRYILLHASDRATAWAVNCPRSFT
jgi:hypothetical protein